MVPDFCLFGDVLKNDLGHFVSESVGGHGANFFTVDLFHFHLPRRSTVDSFRLL